MWKCFVLGSEYPGIAAKFDGFWQVESQEKSSNHGVQAWTVAEYIRTYKWTY